MWNTAYPLLGLQNPWTGNSNGNSASLVGTQGSVVRFDQLPPADGVIVKDNHRPHAVLTMIEVGDYLLSGGMDVEEGYIECRQSVDLVVQWTLKIKESGANLCTSWHLAYGHDTLISV